MTLVEAADRLRRAKADADRAGRAVSDAHTALDAAMLAEGGARSALHAALTALRDAAMLADEPTKEDR